MPTADKLITVAENVPKVYHAGQLNVIENASTLKKSASGSVILIDDVSPVTHNMEVKISSIPKKNLLNRLIAKAYNSSDMNVPTEDFINTYCSKKISFKQGTTYAFSIKNVSGFVGNVAWSPRFYIFDNGSLFVSNTPSTPPVTFSTVFFTSNSSANEYVCQNGSALWSKSNMITNQGPWSMTITPVKDFEAAFIITDGAVTDSVIVTEAQIEVGSTVTSYAPYIENPITDLTTVRVKKQGKNLFDKNNVNKLAAYINGSTITSGGQMSTVWVPCSPLTTYTVSKIKSSRFSVCFASEVPTIGGTVNNKITNNASTQITNTSSDTDKYIVIWLYHSGHDTDIAESEILDSLQIELGSTATEYEPYVTSTEYTPTADGTVNGVTSLYPNTILTTDTEGVIIDCEYYKDIDANDVIERTVTAYTNPKIKIIGDYAFRNCSSLTSADFPAATSIGNSAFNNCSALTALILRNSTMCTLSNKNAFTGCTKITGTGGYIYVPSSLINTYKTATNWVTYASKFRALEDYTVDGTTTGALDESKVNV